MVSMHTAKPADSRSRSGEIAWYRGMGLTLLELIVALGLSSIVVAAALSLAVATQSASSGQNQRSFMQQSLRAALDIMQDDLYKAGLGMIEQTSGEAWVGEPRAVFSQDIENNSTEPDFLQFRGDTGPVTMTLPPGADTGQGTPVADGATVNLQVPVGQEKWFKFVPGWPNTAKVSFIDRDRRYLGTGDIVTDPVPDSGSLAVVFHSWPGDDAFLGAPVVELPSFTTIIRWPNYISYNLGTDGVLWRCVGPAGAQAANGCPPGSVAEAIADNVEDFQVAFLMKDGTGFNVGWSLSGNGNLANRLNIRAVKAWLIVRASSADRLTPDNATYTTGDRVFIPALDKRMFSRKVMTMITRLPNVVDGVAPGTGGT